MSVKRNEKLQIVITILPKCRKTLKGVTTLNVTTNFEKRYRSVVADSKEKTGGTVQ
jgi:hypothetical protein